MVDLQGAAQRTIVPSAGASNVDIGQLSHIEFPSELRRAPGRPFRGASFRFSFPAALTTALGEFAAQRGGSLLTTALAGIGALLYRYTKHVRHAERIAVASALGRV